MKKCMAMLVFAGVMVMIGLGGAPPARAVVPSPPAMATGSDADPCPSCCPPSICGLNGPSLDGTTQAAQALDR
jgi:hypothetical protein